ncbi:hypothetical protein AAE478_005156 [Parahypoxylon ruwenzoriense]
MKSFSTTLVFIPVLTIVAASEISDIYKKGLGNSDCTNIHLTDRYTLHATCTNPGYGTSKDFSLNLNECFANYLGTLNHTPNGGFGGSCSPCTTSGTELVCECQVGEGHGTRYNAVDLGDWNTIQLSDGKLSCSDTSGVEKRAKSKEARFFIA